MFTLLSILKIDIKNPSFLSSLLIGGVLKLISSFKYPSDDDTSSVTSGSGPSGAHSSPRPQVQQTSTAPAALSDLQVHLFPHMA